MVKKSAQSLLRKLGIPNYTNRHVQIINDFVESEETKAEDLLDKLGSWDVIDLDVTQRWLKE